MTSQKAFPSHTFYVKIKASKINTKQFFFCDFAWKTTWKKMRLWRSLLHEHVCSIMTLCSGHFFREQQKSHHYNYTPFKNSQISLVGQFLCLVSSKAMICLFSPLALSRSLSLFLPVWDWKWMPTLKDACQREAVKQLKRSNCFCVFPQWLKGRNILSLLWHKSSKAAAEEKRVIFARTLAGPCAQEHCNV